MSEGFSPAADVLTELMELRARGLSAVMVTVVSRKGSVPRKPGARMLVLADGSTRGTIGGGVREAEIIAAARDLFRKNKPGLRRVDFQEGISSSEGPICGGTMEVFMERIDPRRRVIIAGGGHIGYYLHRFMSMLEFKVVIYDERPDFADSERFPGAELLVSSFADGMKDLIVTPNDAVVVVTPEHKFDQVVLAQALRTPAGYIGMIGSKKKIKGIFDNLRAEGFSEERLSRVQSPIGLDIGAESPAEIALAIAAEIVSVFKNRES